MPFTYYSESFQKDYAVFYNEKDKNHLLAYAFDENNALSVIETAEEGAEVEVALRRYDEETASKD